jgi:cephalosporin hydroxylase
MTKCNDDTKQFEIERDERVRSYAKNKELITTGQEFLLNSLKQKYSYNFHWMGLPIIQYPQDIVALQEIIWETQPDLIIETGVARGGSLLLYASLLEMIQSNGIVVGIDVDIRKHNRKRVIEHTLSHRIRLIESSSLDETTIAEVKLYTEGKNRIMVILDSNHTHQHVLNELNLYAPLVSDGCYLVVFDTVVEDMPKESFPDRPWGKGNNPKTAVLEFMSHNKDFQIDELLEQKLIISAAPSGYLRRSNSF